MKVEITFADGQKVAYENVTGLWVVPSEGCHFRSNGRHVYVPPYQVKTIIETE